jgi:hypothetical protein
VKPSKKDRPIYCTTYCNFGHYLDNGAPVDHECRRLPVAALEAERAGDYALAQRLISLTTTK